MIRSLSFCLASLLLIFSCKKEGDASPGNSGIKNKYFFTMTIDKATYTYGFDTTACDLTACSLGGPYGVELRSDSSIYYSALIGGVDVKSIQVLALEKCQYPAAEAPCLSLMLFMDSMSVGSYKGGVMIFKPGDYRSSGQVDRYDVRSPDLPVTYTITMVGPIGGLIQGSFQGTVYDNTTAAIATKPVKGSFSVQRSR